MTFKITTDHQAIGHPGFHYGQDDRRFDAALAAIERALLGGFDSDRELPVGDLLARVRNADEQLHLSRTDIYIINQAASAAGLDPVAVWAEVASGKLAAHHGTGAAGDD